MNPPRTTHEALVALTTLTDLPSINPWRLRRLLWHHAPTEALELLQQRKDLHPMVHRALDPAGLRTLRDEARRVAVGAALERCVAATVDVVPITDPRYPPALIGDPEAPVVLFTRGDLGVLDARRVAIVGTRNATTAGRSTAIEFGRELGAQGVTVVSGLARGIDGAAHRGVRLAEGRPAGVVANGLDVAYPKQHRELWNWVAEAGVLLSEWPPGASPEPWRFPLRNRVIAALAEVLIVVESRSRGGSLITARAALDRGVPVMAVPGSVHNRAAEGTNALLQEGAHPATSVAEVFTSLGLTNCTQGRLPLDLRPTPTGLQRQVLEQCRDVPRTLDMLVAELGCPVTDAALAATKLVHDRWLVEAGGWFELAGSRLRVP